MIVYYAHKTRESGNTDRFVYIRDSCIMYVHCFRSEYSGNTACWAVVYTTGSSRLDPGFYGVRVVHICGGFLVVVWPCQLFVRLWYHVSDVLDLSLVSKRFGFWPHITYVIVLTFKEIKHLSDYRTVALEVGPRIYTY